MQATSSKTKHAPSERSYTKSSSFLMAIIFTILCGAAAISLGYFINYFAKGHFVETTEALLDTQIRYMQAVGVENAITEEDGKLYIFLNEDGRLPSDLPASISRFAEGIIVFERPTTKRRYAAKIHIFNDGRKLLIGTDITKISKDFRFMQLIGLISIAFVMLVVFVAYIISVFVVSGTNKIAATAYDIMKTGDLSRRVEIGTARWDDLSHMAVTLNLLLDRIELLMSGVRQVSDNIAHDLRTPLTRMRNRIEDLENKYGHEDYTELMTEADHILSTFNALLRISRIEAEKKRSQFAPLNLEQLIHDVGDFYAPLAEDKNITLTIDTAPATIDGDRDLLFQAYANLLDNAIKFTPTGGTITLALSRKKKQTVIRVTDTGAGINEDEKDKIFTRFYRSEKCRSTPGTGLGLSLVSAVITLHNGHINVETHDPGLSIITIL